MSEGHTVFRGAAEVHPALGCVSTDNPGRRNETIRSRIHYARTFPSPICPGMSSHLSLFRGRPAQILGTQNDQQVCIWTTWPTRSPMTISTNSPHSYRDQNSVGSGVSGEDASASKGEQHTLGICPLMLMNPTSYSGANACNIVEFYIASRFRQLREVVETRRQSMEKHHGLPAETTAKVAFPRRSRA